jgi:ABC-type multidrug transport system fused ATPase/permease subunit
MPTGRMAGGVRFDHVTFRYPGTSRPALSDVSFSIEPGESVAIVGSNGAGKSTVMKLLLRWYDPDAGSISLDGVDVRELTLRSLRAQVAVVLQDSLAFDGTIASNIAYGGAASDRDVVEAARRAGVDRPTVGEVSRAAEQHIG